RRMPQNVVGPGLQLLFRLGLLVAVSIAVAVVYTATESSRPLDLVKVPPPVGRVERFIFVDAEPSGQRGVERSLLRRTVIEANRPGPSGLRLVGFEADFLVGHVDLFPGQPLRLEWPQTAE